MLAGGAFALFFIVVMALSLGGLVLWVIALIDVVKAPDHAFRMAGTEKVTWVLVVVLVSYIGALVWWFGPRKRVHAAAAAYPVAMLGGPQFMSGPPPGWYPDPSGAPGQAWWDGRGWTRPGG